MFKKLKAYMLARLTTKEVSNLRGKLANTQKSLARQKEQKLRWRKEAKWLQEDAPRAFHRFYYDAGIAGEGTWQKTHWLGVPTLKLPLDLWVYQEILYETKPDLIIETGTANGGSALYLASICDLLGRGRVVTIDITETGPSGAPRPKHPRIRYLLGSSTSQGVLKEVRREAEEATTVMVILDSDHSEAHVLAELKDYAPFVSVGCYLVVEDTNVNGHPVLPNHGPGPMEAVESFVAGSSSFAIDYSKEKFFVTFNPKGYLKRIE